MKRCLELAIQGAQNVAPNPMVGSVVVYKNRIIGEGYHQKFGQAHAEVNAINSVKEQELLSQSTLYVNLEPCSHYGKTPPCSDLIIQKKIPRVVVACIDTFAKVSGRGVERMRKAGIDVKVGVLEKEAIDFNRRFFTYHNQKRPYIILKWAQTLDGFIDLERPPDTPVRPYWITNELARRVVHRWRAEEAAIMVGTNTALKDNPMLTIRDWHGKNPLRIVIDRNLRLPQTLSLFDQTTATIVFNAKKNQKLDNLNFIEIAFDDRNKSIEQMMSILFEQKILSVIIEGGAELLNSFIKNKLWDEARIFIGNKHFHKGTKAPAIYGELDLEQNFNDSKLFVFRNK